LALFCYAMALCTGVLIFNGGRLPYFLVSAAFLLVGVCLWAIEGNKPNGAR